MDLGDVLKKHKRGNKILFSRDSPCLQELSGLLKTLSHKAVVLWAFECVQSPLRVLKQRCPEEKRSQAAVALCQDWAKGRVKMPIAKKALLQAHAAAKELPEADAALCHAVGQACATVHVKTHAIGLALYELTALVKEYGIEDCNTAVENKIREYVSCLKACAKKAEAQDCEWADFMSEEGR